MPGSLGRPRTRRELLKLTPALAAAAFLVPRWRDPLLGRGLRLSDWLSAKAFRPGHLAPTFRDADIVTFDRFPYNYFDVVEPDLDFNAWTLDVSGAVARPGRYTLDDVRRLPKRTQNTRLVCVEGWDVIGNFAGAKLADFLDRAGASPMAEYVTVTCADGYYESLDMATARHPQTLLAYEMYGRALNRGHGAPLRLQIPTTLGYKQAKYLMTLEVVHELGVRRSYWADRGYSWHAGI